MQQDVYLCTNDSGIINADIIGSLPVLNLTFSDLHYSLTPQNYALISPDNVSLIILLVPIDNIDHWVIGTCFLRNFYTLLDYDKNRIALIPYANDTVYTKTFQ